MEAPLALEKIHPSPPVEARPAFVEIAIIVVFTIKFVQDFIKSIFFFIDFFFGGPAGSGGKFREAALQINAQVETLYYNTIEPLGKSVYQGAWKGWSDAVHCINWQGSKIYDQQGHLWDKYEGSNLLGATFFGGWTNQHWQSWVLMPLMNFQAAYSELQALYTRDKVNILQDEIDTLAGRIPPSNGYQQLLDRINKLESMFNAEHENTWKQLAAQAALLHAIQKIINDILSGKQKLPPPPQLQDWMKGVQNQLAGLQKGLQNLQQVQIPQLQSLIKGIQGQIATVNQTMRALQDLIKQADLPGIRQKLDDLGKQVLEIPPLIQGMKDLQQKVKDILEQKIPKLQDQIDRLIPPLQRRLENIEQNELPKIKQRIEQCCQKFDNFMLQLPIIIQKTIETACQCGYNRTKPYVDYKTSCDQVLNTLNACCKNGTDSQKAAFHDLWLCMQGGDQPGPGGPLKPYTNALAHPELLHRRKVN